MSINILGIDLGTQISAVTKISGEKEVPIFETVLLTAGKKDPMPTRFLYMCDSLMEIIDHACPELVVVEYPFNIKGHAKILVELFGIMRYTCLKNDYPFVAMPQTRLKKYATGKGGAEKSDMRMQVYKEFNLDLSEDGADSFWIAHMGMTYNYGSSLKYRQESIDAIKKQK